MLIIQRYFYHNQGKLEQAESLYQRTLAIQERMPGPEHPDTAQSLNNLAVPASRVSLPTRFGDQGEAARP
jgi:hypothetical protein